MKINSLFALLVLVLSLTSAIAQPTILKDKKVIFFVPIVDVGTKLNYEVTRFENIPIDSGGIKLDTTRYYINLVINGFQDSAFNISATIPMKMDEVVDPIFEGLECNFKYNIISKERTILNRDELVHTILNRIEKQKEVYHSDTSVVKSLSSMSLAVSEEGRIKKLFGEVEDLLSFYGTPLPYKTALVDTIQKKGMFGDIENFIVTQEVVKAKKSYIFNFKKKLDAKSSMNKLLQKSVKDQFGEDVKLVPSEAEKNQFKVESYNYVDVSFNKKKGTVTSVVKDEKKTIFGTIIQFKKEYRLVQ